MSETIIPDAVNVASDVLENQETAQLQQEENPVEETASEERIAEKSLAEIIGLFENLLQSEDAMARAKEAETIKAAFYRKFNKEKTDEDPLEAIEEGFKSLFNVFKEKRTAFNREQEALREDNLKKKLAVIEDLKDLVEKQEDVNATFPAFREIQNRWREIGAVPATSFRDVNDRYQFFVEKFYDMVKINQELRDLDFKKNLEAKQQFCELAEKLAENENVIEAFRELQKLHEQWKEFGPVAKEFRESIWERFKAATAIINKKYQAHFEGLKEQQGENLERKTSLCEKLEAIAAKAEAEIKSSNEWNALSHEIEELQKEWKTIGFASKKENQKIYDRFRAACDKFFEKKREFYSSFKDSMNENFEKKMDLVRKAEALKSSTEWKKATDEFIELQKQWKEIGAVPRKKSEQLWKQFRAACDEFFAERDKNAKPENDFHANLRAKKALIEEIAAFELTSDQAAMAQAAEEFRARWAAIGFVPFKEKDAVAQAYKEAFQAKFPDAGSHRNPFRGNAHAPKSPRDLLIQKYNTLQQEILNFENNIGFFAMSKNAEALIAQMQKKIEAGKKELKDLELQIRNAENAENTEN